MLKAPHQTPQNILLGVTLIVVTAFAISVQDVVFKLFSSELTLWQIFALRGCLAVPVLFAIAFAQKGAWANVRSAFSRWSMLRAVFITGTFLAFYGAIPFLSLSTVGAANYTAPLFVALLSAYVIKEPVGWLGWVGVVIGFAGVIVLLQPGTDAFSVWALLPIFGAVSYALAHIITRTKCQGVPLAALSLAQNSAMLCAGLVVSLILLLSEPGSAFVRDYPYIFGLWSPVGIDDWMVLSVLAGFAILLGMMLAGAYKAAPPSIVATFEYSYLVFVAAWDVLFFGLVLGVSTLGGMALIVLAGLLVLRRGSGS
ncbi:DMT family transporter [Cognatiyoonia sp. IB215446]|uniref:DMT family transporter n=1 Tax=Cognatiyoonia sp. IB215446 TaxID=3097355 RepID=UPI002A107F17|nr:DMT family transporter [Cognatiyoonia sp. IB215446]MDX8350464.1 DMT family transporter [Cognatiyoonia sp. IB215446]